MSLRNKIGQFVLVLVTAFSFTAIDSDLADAKKRRYKKKRKLRYSQTIRPGVSRIEHYPPSAEPKIQEELVDPADDGRIRNDGSIADLKRGRDNQIKAAIEINSLLPGRMIDRVRSREPREVKTVRSVGGRPSRNQARSETFFSFPSLPKRSLNFGGPKYSLNAISKKLGSNQHMRREGSFTLGLSRWVFIILVEVLVLLAFAHFQLKKFHYRRSYASFKQLVWHEAFWISGYLLLAVWIIPGLTVA